MVPFSLEHGHELIHLARLAATQAIVRRSVTFSRKQISWFSFYSPTFVTLYKQGVERGMGGRADDGLPLYEGIAFAGAAAARDQRYPPLLKEEMGQVTVEVAVLSIPRFLEVHNPEELLSL